MAPMANLAAMVWTVAMVYMDETLARASGEVPESGVSRGWKVSQERKDSDLTMHLMVAWAQKGDKGKQGKRGLKVCVCGISSS